MQLRLQLAEQVRVAVNNTRLRRAREGGEGAHGREQLLHGKRVLRCQLRHLPMQHLGEQQRVIVAAYSGSGCSRCRDRASGFACSN